MQYCEGTNATVGHNDTTNVTVGHNDTTNAIPNFTTTTHDLTEFMLETAPIAEGISSTFGTQQLNQRMLHRRAPSPPPSSPPHSIQRLIALLITHISQIPSKSCSSHKHQIVIYSKLHRTQLTIAMRCVYKIEINSAKPSTTLASAKEEGEREHPESWESH
jgi:hypothetical protein